MAKQKLSDLIKDVPSLRPFQMSTSHELEAAITEALGLKAGESVFDRKKPIPAEVQKKIKTIISESRRRKSVIAEDEE